MPSTLTSEADTGLSTLTVPEVQKILRLPTTDAVYRRLNDGIIPGIRIGKFWRIPRREVRGVPGRTDGGAGAGAAGRTRRRRGRRVAGPQHWPSVMACR